MDTYSVLNLIESHEGRSAYMYADTSPTGTPTVGVGHALETVEMAQVLPFFCNDNLATKAQIADVWNLVKRTRTTDHTLHLQESAIDSLLESDLQKSIRVARNTFPEFDSYPQCAQEAILDMIFNLGSLVDFPRFVAAVKSRNWVVAAQECLRRGVGTQRNLDTQRLLLQAKEANKDSISA